MDKVGETVLEIDLRALEHNYNYLRSQIKRETKFLGVVKAFAYGSDSIAIAKKLEVLGADYLAVAYTNEGIALR
ncbi:MAG TPA: alanine racemase, partial [Arenibacter sp.]|nr:alanine racemase [Arenibacter sp.]